MTDRPHCLDLLHQMRQVNAPVTSAEAEHARRERIRARVSELQVDFNRRKAQRQRWQAVAVVAGPLLAAASMLLWLGWSRVSVSVDGSAASSAPARVHPQPSTRDLGAAPAVSAQEGFRSLPQAFESPREVVVEASTEQLRMPSSATLKATRGTRYRVERERVQGDRWRETVEVVSGQLEVEVPRHDPGTRLIVRTQSMTIDVDSTRFAIDVPKDPEQPTCVNVVEGTLTVRTWAGMRVISAGQRWESPGHAHATTPAEHGTATGKSGARAAADRPVPEASTSPDQDWAASRLGEANRAMQAALLAKTGGMKQLALQRFGEVIQRYPETEAAATARAERFRLLAQLGRAAAARQAAKNYLAAHPDGFARREARALLDATP